jgi:UDP-glucose 4-epimerase
VVVLDNLSTGHRAAVHPAVTFYEGDVGDMDLVKSIIEKHDVQACMHFAAFADVAESVKEPARYFKNNTFQTNNLLNVLLKSNVKKFVFSSTCATYGRPIRIPIAEDHPQNPVNPYGWSKFMTERILDSYDAAYGFRSVALRYFNAAGATARNGERHLPETHLIPNVLSAASGQIPFVSVYGNDYDTPDGTCIRDYIHVEDLADAHLRALKYLRFGGDSTKINLGNGAGFSVFEVIETARQVTGRDFELRLEPRRAGDPDRLVADAAKALEILGWQPQFPELEAIVRSAWRWKKEN